jgi:hypothetical protein
MPEMWGILWPEHPVGLAQEFLPESWPQLMFLLSPAPAIYTVKGNIMEEDYAFLLSSYLVPASPLSYILHRQMYLLHRVKTTREVKKVLW